MARGSFDSTIISLDNHPLEEVFRYFINGQTTRLTAPTDPCHHGATTPQTTTRGDRAAFGDYHPEVSARSRLSTVDGVRQQIGGGATQSVIY